MDLSVDFVRSFDKLYKLPFDTCVALQKKQNFDVNQLLKRKPLKVLLFCVLAGGSGDAMFAIKLKKFIKEWYPKLHIKIATNGYDIMLNLGEKKEDLLHLKPRFGELQHRPYDVFTMIHKQFDVILVAPLTSDLHPKDVRKNLRYHQIRQVIPYSNRFNTFFMSEYNLGLHDDIYFPIGVGNSRLGLFLTHNHDFCGSSPKVLEGKYTLMYLNENDDHLLHCIYSFLEMLTAKYKFSELQVVAPKWIKQHLSKEKLRRHVDNYYEINLGEEQSKPQLRFRFDILPQPHAKMISLMEHSLPFLLLTGDQSITDCLSVCSEEVTIFYQSLSWKQNFYTSMARIIPNKFMKSYKTSCGSMEAIHFHPSYRKLIKNWDFRILGRPFMDAAMMLGGGLLPELENYKEIVLESRSVKAVREKLQVDFLIE